MFQCVQFWGWKALEGSLDQSNAIEAKEMTVFQITLCSMLVRKPVERGPGGAGAPFRDFAFTF